MDRFKRGEVSIVELVERISETMEQGSFRTQRDRAADKANNGPNRRNSDRKDSEKTVMNRRAAAEVGVRGGV